MHPSLHFVPPLATLDGMAAIPNEFHEVTALTKANVYFDGKVISHTLLFPDGSKKTLGLIYAGRYHFGTDKAERMELVSGECSVKVDGTNAFTSYVAGQVFEVPAKSGFDIEVKSGICQYICSFLD
jgi:uncharacterized protein YaiE (UPF0345 family)